MAQQMNNEMIQLSKKLDWLDSERRKDKNSIAVLEERINQMQNDNIVILAALKETRNELGKYTNVQSRFEQLESMLTQLRIDAFRSMEERERLRIEKEREMDALRIANHDTLLRSYQELKKMIDPLMGTQKALQMRTEEEARLGRNIEELATRIDQLVILREDIDRFQRMAEDSRRQDSKKMTDMQAELIAFRKRFDEILGKTDLYSENLRKMEAKVTAIAAMENERKTQQLNFQEKISVSAAERDRTWQEWRIVLDGIAEKSLNVENALQNIENVHRSVKRSQDSLEEVTQRFDRRANELIEMQRLTEEKFHQEWITFKDDDQKRWTNYAIGQDDLQSEYERAVQMLKVRMDALEDLATNATDDTHIRNELYVQQLQELFTMVRSWLEKMSKS